MNEPSEESLARHLDAQAELIGLSIDAAHRPGTLDNLQRIAAMAPLFMEFALPAEIEAAPVFSASLPDGIR